jgi:signal transduction histidine kinase
MKNIITKISSLLFYTNVFSPLRQRIFISIVFLSIILTVIGNVVNILLNFEATTIFATFIVTLVYVFVFIKARKCEKDNIDFYYYIFWGITYISVSYLWFLNAGIDSNFLVLLVMGYIGLHLTSKQKSRPKALIIYLTFVVILILTDFYFPEIFIRYENKAQRITDLVVGMVVYISIIHHLLNVVSQQSNFEQNKLKIKNIQLDDLNKERKELNDKLELSVKQMEYANSSKDRFISIIAHDLRSPFQGLLGVSRLLKENYDALDDYEKRQLIEKLNNLLEKQYSFLEELLLWGRLQRSNISLKTETVNLKEILVSELSHLTQIIERKKLNVKLFESTNFEIKTDRNLISTVFRNILSNAVKFSPVGQKIEVFLECKGNSCYVKFKDYGLGISEEDLPNLFLLDSKVSRKGTDGETGSGFGLVLCSDIMKKLNGEISIESREGAGTTVTITIPK